LNLPHPNEAVNQDKHSCSTGKNKQLTNDIPGLADLIGEVPEERGKPGSQFLSFWAYQGYKPFDLLLDPHKKRTQQNKNFVAFCDVL